MSFWKYAFKNRYFTNGVLLLGIMTIAMAIILISSGEIMKSGYAFGFWFLTLGLATIIVSESWTKVKSDYRTYRRNLRRGKYASRSISEYKVG